MAHRARPRPAHRHDDCAGDVPRWPPRRHGRCPLAAAAGRAGGSSPTRPPRTQAAGSGTGERGVARSAGGRCGERRCGAIGGRTVGDRPVGAERSHSPRCTPPPRACGEPSGSDSRPADVRGGTRDASEHIAMSVPLPLAEHRRRGEFHCAACTAPIVARRIPISGRVVSRRRAVSDSERRVAQSQVVSNPRGAARRRARGVGRRDAAGDARPVARVRRGQGAT